MYSVYSGVQLEIFISESILVNSCIPLARYSLEVLVLVYTYTAVLKYSCIPGLC
jgi:hypothetical protein